MTPAESESPAAGVPSRASFPEMPESIVARLPHPLVQAPMAGGGSTPALAAAVSGAGGLGFLAAGYKTPQAVREEIALTRRLTDAPFGVNLFVPGEEPADAAEAVAAYREELADEAKRYDVELPETPEWDDDWYQEKLDLLAEAAVPLVSFTFGCPSPDAVVLLQSAGSEVAVTVTSPEEAVEAVRAGADALCVQGPEAGGHRGAFTAGGGSSLPLVELVPVVREAVAAEGAAVPLLAAGGVMDGAGVAAVLAAGADAAQLGTAFLVTPESGASELHRSALRGWPAGTVVTSAFSGRPARGLLNRFISERERSAPVGCYPRVHHLTASLRRAAVAAGDPEAVNLWAGSGFSRSRELPAAELVEVLVAEAAVAAGLPPQRRA